MFPRLNWQYILVTRRTVDKLGVQSEDIYLAQFKHLLGIRITNPLTLDSDRIEFPMMTIFIFCGSGLAPYRPRNISPNCKRGQQKFASPVHTSNGASKLDCNERRSLGLAGIFRATHAVPVLRALELAVTLSSCTSLDPLLARELFLHNSIC